MWHVVVDVAAGGVRFDDGIPGEEVNLHDGETEAQLLSKRLAVELAHSRGLNLIQWWPDTAAGPVSCIIGKVGLPLRWETYPTEDPVEAVDENLWFDAPCGERDFLLDGSGNTFPGRMSAWCPTKNVTYNVSLSEIARMSERARGSTAAHCRRSCR